MEKKEKMQDINLKGVKLKSFALIVIALMIIAAASAAITITPVKAQVTTLPANVADIGPPQSSAYAGGAVPAGVTPTLSIPTIPYLSFSPNPDGFNQNLLINFWVQPTLPVYRVHTTYTITITLPDKSVETIGPLDSYIGDTTCFMDYTLTQVGNYTIQFSFGGDYYPPGYYILGQQVANGNVQMILNNVLTNATFIGPGSVYYKPHRHKSTLSTYNKTM